jgi:hypothetical protein
MRVRISVVGGVAYVEEVPPGVVVEVTDYDVDARTAERDEHGRACSRYQVTAETTALAEVA